MSTSIDTSGHHFIDVDNIRLTYVPASDRTGNQDWAGSDVIRIQAYKDKSSGNSLHRGAELPVGSPEAVLRLVEGLCKIYSEARVTTGAVS